MALLDDFKAKRPHLRDVDYFHSAVMLSVVLHLSVALVWALNQQFKFFHPDLFKFLEKVDPTRVLVQRKKEEKKIVDTRLQKVIQFKLAEVSPSQTSVVVPKNAEYYGAANSIASNQRPSEKDSGRARIDGAQDQMVRIETQARPTEQPPAPPVEEHPTPPQPPQPATTRPEPEKTPKVENPPPPKPEPVKPPPPEVVKVAKILPPSTAPPAPERKPGPEAPKPPAPEPLPPTPRPRPRSLKEARQREADRLQLVGRQMKQEGGVRRLGAPSLNVMGTSFGAYDTKLSRLIQNAWFLLLEGRVSPVGKVVVKFRLMADGRVTNVEIVETTVDDLFTTICQMSVNGPKFDRWPPEMRRQLENDHRDHTITFFYN